MHLARLETTSRSATSLTLGLGEMRKKPLAPGTGTAGAKNTQWVTQVLIGFVEKVLFFFYKKYDHFFDTLDL